jgi:RNA recognition motif-containing protein
MSVSRSRSPSVSHRQERNKVRSRSYSRSPSRSRSRSERRREEKRNDRREEIRDDRERPQDSTSVLVRKLSFRTTTQDLRRPFENFGEVTDVYIPLEYHSRRPRGFGFVKFANRDHAEAAIKALDGTEIDGANVEVVLAQESRKSPRTMRQMTRSGRGDRRGRREHDDRGRSGYGYRDRRRSSRSASRSWSRSRSRSRSHSRRRDDRSDRRDRKY